MRELLPLLGMIACSTTVATGSLAEHCVRFPHPAPAPRGPERSL